MTKSYSLHTLVTALIFAAIGLGILTLQYLTNLITQGLSDSAGIRVSAATVCSTENAHFTGCSSIL